MELEEEVAEARAQAYRRIEQARIRTVRLLLLCCLLGFAWAAIVQISRANSTNQGHPEAIAQQTTRTGTASWYSVESCLKESGQFTMANGEVFDDEVYTCAIWNYPFGAILEVTNLDTGASVEVKVTDRGPAKYLVKQRRIIDLSKAAFAKLAPLSEGLIEVRIEQIERR